MCRIHKAFTIRIPLGAILCLFLILLSSCDNIPSSSPFDLETVRALQTSLDDSVSFLTVPGAVVLIKAPDGSQWIGSSGVFRIESSGPWRGPSMGRDLYFRVGSNTKTLTATIILQLEEEGKLTLEDSVYHWIGDIVPNSKKITVYNLLSMTSGLQDFTTSSFMNDTVNDPLRHYTPEELIQLSNANKGGVVKFAPGERWDYCNTNFILLGMIIERVTGDTYEHEVAERILKPLNLSHTLAPGKDEFEMPAPYAHGYVFLEKNPDGWKDLSVQNASAAWSAGSLISTAEDMGNWIDNLIGGVLLEETSRNKMFNWKYTNEMKEFKHYGLGVLKYNGAIGHIGSILGYRSCIMGYQGYSFVVLLNSYPTIREYEHHDAIYVYQKLAETLGLYSD
ncbi:serine hydrolase domain-containing protein [Thermodesulfobacteriota bacterium]